MNPLRLIDDGLQRLRALRIGLMPREILGLSGDDGERIVDFVPGAGGQLGEGVELLDLEPLALPRALLLESALELIDVVLQPLHEDVVRAAAILESHLYQIGEQRTSPRRLPGRRACNLECFHLPPRFVDDIGT